MTPYSYPLLWESVIRYCKFFTVFRNHHMKRIKPLCSFLDPPYMSITLNTYNLGSFSLLNILGIDKVIPLYFFNQSTLYKTEYI
jgi:hypothetical protein